MQFVSFLGLLALLGVAWAMSYHHSAIRLRPIVWGIGLQFLFALIILRNDYWSFVGMGLFAALLAVYMMQKHPVVQRARWPGMVLIILVGGATAWLASVLISAYLGWALLALLALLVANARWAWRPRWQGFGGVLFVMLGVAWFVSHDLHGQRLFEGISANVASFLSLSDYGARFLFANLADPQYFGPNAAGTWPGFGFLFAFKVLPTIVFFGGFMAVLYYLGIMQKVILAMSRFMRWTIGTSGAETLSCSANIFVGQTEAPLLIKPFLDGMTRSELLTVMVGGFSTIAGGVLAGYIAMGIDAGYLIAASVMSAPAALVIAKIIYPELEKSQTAGKVEMPEIQSGGNVIEAATSGISDGLRLAVNVGAMLLGFIALIAVVDLLLNWIDSIIDGDLLRGVYHAYDTTAGMSPIHGEFSGIFPGSLQTLFGTVLKPLAWLMGVPWTDAGKVGNLLGIKLSLNEFVAYGTLSQYMHAGALSPRAVLISTYALCGFANFSSIGIQIGGISALAPGRRADLAKVGLKAMFGGALASWLTATIAGVLLG